MNENKSIDEQNIPIRSGLLDDIINRIPRWPIRWGNSIFLLIVLSLFLLSWFIHYPDSTSGKITILTKQMPVRVVALVEGNIDTILVSEKQLVQQHDHLVVLKSPAVYHDILLVSKWMEMAESVVTSGEVDLILPDSPINLSLGTVQESYRALQQTLSNNYAFEIDNYYISKISSLEKQIEQYKKLEIALINQKRSVIGELKLVKNNFERNKSLFEKQLLSVSDFDRVRQDLFKKEFEVDNSETAIATCRINLHQTQASLIELKHQSSEQKRVLNLSVLETYNKLKYEVNSWNQKYLLKAPERGRISFPSSIQKNQFVKISEPVLTIVQDSGEIIGKVPLHQAGSGKIKLGQIVRITLDGYPSLQFGFVKGVVDDIALVSEDKSYIITVKFPEGLKTSYNIIPKFRQEMQGTAELIFQNQNLLERIFGIFRYTFAKNINSD